MSGRKKLVQDFPVKSRLSGNKSEKIQLNTSKNHQKVGRGIESLLKNLQSLIYKGLRRKRKNPRPTF